MYINKLMIWKSILPIFAVLYVTVGMPIYGLMMYGQDWVFIGGILLSVYLLIEVAKLGLWVSNLMSDINNIKNIFGGKKQ
jgi:hypothetical protein